MKALPPIPATLVAPAALAAGITVPSRQQVELVEVLVDEVETEVWVRFRFLAPAIGRTAGDLSFEDALADFEYLCTEIALPYLERYALVPQMVAIALMDREVEFGVADPDATQYIELFRVDGQACMPEGLW